MEFNEIQYNNMTITEAVNTDDKMLIKGVAAEYDVKTRNGTSYKKLTYIEKLPAFYEHNRKDIIGNVTFNESGKKVLFEMQLNPELDLAQEVWKYIKHGDITGVSIGSIANEWTYDEDTDTIIIHEAELIELSIVSVPAARNARVATFESAEDKNKIEKKINDVEIKSNIRKENRKMIDYNKVKMSELQEMLLETQDKHATYSIKVEKLTNQITEAEDVDKAEKMLEDKNASVEIMETLEKEMRQIQKELAVREHALQDVKNKNDAVKFTETEGRHAVKSIENTQKGIKSFMDSIDAKNAFVDALCKVARNSSLSMKNEFTKNVQNEGFTGDISGLFPTMVDNDISDKMEETGKLLPFLNRITGTTALSKIVNLGEDLGYGYTYDETTPENNKKIEQNNQLDTIEIMTQYVYKYVPVTREMLDQTNNVLYDYIITELSNRLVMTIERAVLVGDGLDPSNRAKITKIIPMDTHNSDNFGTTIEQSDIDMDTLDDMDTPLLENGSRTIFAMNKATYKALKKIRTTSGERIYEVSTETINGKKYNTLDGYIVVENPWLKPFSDITAGSDDYGIIAFKAQSYDLVTFQENAEMFTDFKLSTNTNEFLTEIRAGGDVVKLKAVSVLKKS